MNGRDWLALLGCVLLCNAAGALGAVATAGAVDGWYGTLVRPPLNPPSWVFGPVWTLLYTLMGGALWLVLHRVAPSPARRRALVLFGVQLVLNAAWSPVFFGAHALGAALVVIVALWGAILATILAFRRLRPAAAGLLVPYLGWVSFATYLNFMYERLNG